MKAKTERVTRLDYCQYLLVSQINDTLTNYADHTDKLAMIWRTDIWLVMNSGLDWYGRM